MRIHTVALFAAMLTCAACASVASAQSLGSAITYQGMFADNGAPANGHYDFEFVLYPIDQAGTALQTVSKANVAVSGGLINTLVDFGAATYDGQVKWVEVHVRPAGGGAYTTLNPRQALTAAPYAMGLPMPFNRTVSTGNSPAFVINAAQSGTAISGSVPSFSGNPAVSGTSLGSGPGVKGASAQGDGVFGSSTSLIGVHGDGGRLGGYFQGGLEVDTTNASCDPATSCYAALIIHTNTNPDNMIVATSVADNTFRVSRLGAVYATSGYNTGGADLAEHVPASVRLQAGDVVEIDATNGDNFQLSSRSNSTSVAGVISTKPGVTLNSMVSVKETMDETPRLALSGRVPVKVTSENGAIHAGDLLVSSSRPGRAMRAPASPQAGTVIGKAMQQFDRDSGEIEMLVMLR